MDKKRLAQELSSSDIPNNNMSFVKETIIVKPNNRKRLLRMVFVTVFLALIFGVVASLTSYGIGKVIGISAFSDKKNENNDNNNEPEEVTKDTKNEETSEPIKEEETKKVYVEKDINLESLKKISAIVSNSIKKTSSFVKVAIIMQEEETYISGLVLKKEGLVLVLVDSNLLKGAKKIELVIEDKRFETVISNNNTNLGLAILSIPEKSISKDLLSKIKVVEFTEKKTLELGESIIFAGTPFGTNDYFTLGFISSKAIKKVYTDACYSMYITDVKLTNNNNGFLFDLDSKLIGIVTSNLGQVAYDNNVVALSAKELESAINSMINNEKVMYLGIKGEKVSSAMKEVAGFDMPEGIYVSSVEKNSPAYLSGLMNGDIIVEIDQEIIKDVSDYMNIINDKKAGDLIAVKIMRRGNQNYNESSLEVKLEMK